MIDIDMLASQFHFAHPDALWLLLAIPAWLIWLWWYGQDDKANNSDHTLADSLAPHVDAALLPHLLGESDTHATGRNRLGRLPWVRRSLHALAYTLLIIALAGPRWDYSEQELFRPDAALMVVLDLSQSMEATDVQPSRIERAQQEMGDILQAVGAHGIRTGIIGFAAFSHVIAPLSEDTESLKALVPSLSPKLMAVQGSDPLEALELARQQLANYTAIRGGDNLHMLLITDGDMGEMQTDVEAFAADMAKGRADTPPISLHVLAIGTQKGAAVPDGHGYYLKESNGQVHLSRLDENAMQSLATQGNGIYQHASYSQSDTARLADAISGKADDAPQMELFRQWNERYHWPLLFAMGVLLCVL